MAGTSCTLMVYSTMMPALQGAFHEARLTLLPFLKGCERLASALELSKVTCVREPSQRRQQPRRALTKIAAAAAAPRSQQVGVLLGVGGDNCTLGIDHLQGYHLQGQGKGGRVGGWGVRPWGRQADTRGRMLVFGPEIKGKIGASGRQHACLGGEETSGEQPCSPEPN